MAASYESYLKFLGELTKILEQLTQIAREKAAAVKRDDLMLLNDCIKREQAVSLSLRSMDKRRESMLSELGLSGVPLSGLAEHYPEPLRQTAKRTAETLRNQFQVYQSAMNVARTTLECNLHQIEKIIEAQEGPGMPPPTGGGMADIRA